VLSCLGRDGDLASASALRMHVWSQPDDQDRYAGDRAIVALDGLPAAIELCRRMGRHLLEQPDASYVPGLDSLSDDPQLVTAALEESLRLARDEPALAVYVAHQQAAVDEDAARRALSDTDQAGNRRRAEEDRIRYPIESMFEMAARRPAKNRGPFMRFGTIATDVELDCILARIDTERDAHTCQRLLQVFRKRPLPYLTERIWALARHDDRDVRGSAMEAMAWIRDPAVGEFARERLRDPDFSDDDAEAILLVARNYALGDEALVLAALKRVSADDDGLHYLGRQVLHLCQHEDGRPLPDLARWIVDTNPCTLCRHSALHVLLKTSQLDAMFAAECRSDAHSETRKLAEQPP
jgi:hypothetical protein